MTASSFFVLTRSFAQEADQNGIFINKRPLVDQATMMLAELQAGKIALGTTFKVVVEGSLGPGQDGKTIVLKNPKLVTGPSVQNDPAMEKFISDWILRVGESGWLGYVERLRPNPKASSTKILITIEQNKVDFSASLQSELSSENEAKTVTSGLSLILDVTRAARPDDERQLLRYVSANSNGKSLTVSFRMPAGEAQQFIQQSLERLRWSLRDETAPIVEVDPGRQALIGWLRKFSTATATKKVRLDSPFVISFAGTLETGSDGKVIIHRNPEGRANKQPKGSDPALVEMVEDALRTAGDTGWFGFLASLNRDPNLGTISLVVQQDSNNFSVDVNYSLDSADAARAVQDSWTSIVQMLPEARLSDDDKFWVKSTSMSSEDKVLKIHFSCARSAFWEMIQRQAASVLTEASSK